MTTSNHVRFECSDIRSVQIECVRCGTSVSYPPDAWKPSGLRCPNCAVTLINGTEGQSEELLAVQELSGGLKRLRAAKNFEFHLRLEFDV